MDGRAAGDPDEGARLDRWLWCTRFFKTRGLATTAVKGGHVTVNGERAKPARAVRPGDWLEIVREQQRWRVEVLSIPARRGPAKDAATWYREDPDSRMQREARLEQLRLDRQLAPGTDGRPDPRTRRRLREMKQG
jgi:ribosome-associated heat shock protein Hsp15